MEIKVLAKTSRSVSVEISDGGIYRTKESYQLTLNGVSAGEIDKAVKSLFNLEPETDYVLEVLSGNGEKLGEVSFTTEYESATLNVRNFGAAGDGVHDDTLAIQAAIMARPPKGRVLIPEGTYRMKTLFMKSNTSLEIAKGAMLKADTVREEHPIFPAVIETKDNDFGEYLLGTWEGDSFDMFTGIITAVDVQNVNIYGEGIVNGNASKEDWWKDAKVKRIAWRPRLLFLCRSENILVQGLELQNSPSWTVHPFFSNHLQFVNLTLKNPDDSPNTDGIDPEACEDVLIAGVHFSLGDDCIAVKSGKISLGKKYKQPSRNLRIRQCLMERGHGAVTVGSEMAGGVMDLIVEDCLFSHTDRGLRVKTRRGRGKDAILSNIVFRHLIMDHVKTPLVVNSFYFCDPDGKDAWVQDRNPAPVDDGTPEIKALIFEDIEAKNCHVAAAHFSGLPEKKIEELVLRDIHITFTENPESDIPAMACGVEPCTKKGLVAENVAKLTLENVTMEGYEGEKFILSGVDELNQK